MRQQCTFGLTPITAEALSIEIWSKVPKLAQTYDPKNGNKAWTQAVKDVLAEIGKRFDFKVMPCVDPHASEFLLDLIWWEDTCTESERRQRAVLAVESEWGNPWHQSKGYIKEVVNEIDDDFWKLLCFKAPLKLLIFSAESVDIRIAIHDRIRRTLSEFEQHIAGEQYLFVEFTNTACYRYRFIVPRDGCIESPELTPLDEGSKNALLRKASA